MAEGYYEGRNEAVAARQLQKANSLKLRQAEGQLGREDAMRRKLQQLAIGKGMEVPDLVDQMALIAAETGNVDEAQQLSTKGASIRKSNQAVAQAKHKQRIEELNLIGGLMDGVVDQASWDQAHTMYELQTGQESPYKTMPFDPDTVKKIRQGVSTLKTRAETAAAQARAAASLSQIEVNKSRIRLNDERARILAKNGGDKFKDGDLKEATDLIGRDYGSVADEELRMHGRGIMERAKAMRDANPALSKSAAIARAYHEKKSAGDFGAFRPRTAKTGAANNPTPLVGADGVMIPKEKLVKGRYYKDPKGRTLVFDGKEFDLFVPPTQTADLGDLSLEDEGEEDGED